MRLLWPSSIACLAQVCSAFYPYRLPADKHVTTHSSRDLQEHQDLRDAKRSVLYPHHTRMANTDHTSKTSRAVEHPRDIDNADMRISLKRKPTKRQNQFNIVRAQDPKQDKSLGVSQDGTDFSYFCSWKIGTSTEEYFMLLDSAASNVWIMGSDCTTDACDVHTTFGPKDSSSLKTSSNTFSVAYGTGSVSGNEGTDTVHLGGMSVPLTFGMAQNVSADFLAYPMDGILGLGRPDTISGQSGGVKAPSLMDVLISQKAISSKLFGLALWRNADGGDNNGEINFGTPDKSRYDGDLNFIPAIKNTNGFWEIPLSDAGVNGKKAGLTGRSAIIDSGTSFILMPQDDAAMIHKMIPGSTQNSETFTVPCDSTAKAQMVFGATTYDISPKDYIGKSAGSGACTSNIIGRQAFSATQWLVGDVFMKNVYTVFDYDGQRVGFGVKGGSSNTAASSTTSAPTTQSTLLPSPTSTSTTPSPALTSPPILSTPTTSIEIPPFTPLPSPPQIHTNPTAPLSPSLSSTTSPIPAQSSHISSILSGTSQLTNLTTTESGSGSGSMTAATATAHATGLLPPSASGGLSTSTTASGSARVSASTHSGAGSILPVARVLEWTVVVAVAALLSVL